MFTSFIVFVGSGIPNGYQTKETAYKHYDLNIMKQKTIMLTDLILNECFVKAKDTRKIITRSMKIGKRGAGVIEARCKPDYRIELYYRYTYRSKREYLFIGPYSQQLSHGYITLSQALDKANEYAEIIFKGGNPSVKAKRERHRAKKKIELEITGDGTLASLLQVYEDSHKHEDTNRDVKSAFDCHVRPHKHLMEMNAKDITWEDIRPIFSEMLKQGKGAMANNLLAYLKAAFNRVMQVRLESGMGLVADAQFGLTENPLQHIKKNPAYHNPGKTNWREQEIAKVWHYAIPICGPIMGRFIRFSIANGGQRLRQTLRVPWKDYQLAVEKPFYVIENMKKKRGGRATPHLVPLNTLALKEIYSLWEHTRHCAYPFAGRVGNGLTVDSYMRNDALDRPMNRISAAAGLRKLRLGELRGTAKTMLGPYRIPKHIKNLIHGHGTMDVADTHYDQFDYFDEKAEALETWSNVLKRITEAYQTKVRLDSSNKCI